jgi:hypothetical protein
MFPFFRSPRPLHENAGFKPNAYKSSPPPSTTPSSRPLEWSCLNLQSSQDASRFVKLPPAAIPELTQDGKPLSPCISDVNLVESLGVLDVSNNSALDRAESFFCSTAAKSTSDLSTQRHSVYNLSSSGGELSEKGECVNGFLVAENGADSPVQWEGTMADETDLASLENLFFQVGKDCYKFNVRLSVESGCETYLLTRGLAIKKILKIVPRNAPHLPFSDPWSVKSNKYYYGEVVSLNKGYILLDYNIIPRTQRYSRSDMQVSIQFHDDENGFFANLSLIDVLRNNLASVIFTLPRSETHMMTLIPVRTLGSGSYGIAQEVQDTSNSNTYVIKIINAGRQDIGYHKAENEISCYETCRKKDSVMPFIAGGAIGGDGLSWYLLMPKGAPLTNEHGMLIYKSDSESLTLSQILILVSRILVDLATIHKKNIAHGDVKGANILVFENLQPRLIDFGSASRVGIRAIHAFEGSIAYIPPEHAGEEQLYSDPRVDDVYAVCVSLYHTFVGEHPLNRKSILHEPILAPVSGMSRANFLQALSSIKFNKREALDASASMSDLLKDMFVSGMVSAESRPTVLTLLRHPVFAGLIEVEDYLNTVEPELVRAVPSLGMNC